MDFRRFDRRGYPVVSAETGYAAWAPQYDACVVDAMDLAMLNRVTSIDWSNQKRCADLACGTGRAGAWLRERGFAGELHGIDLTSEMLHRAEARKIYQHLETGDIRSTGWPAHGFDLIMQSLADEHLPALGPLYDEVARLLAPDGAGRFVIVGYHPQFLMTVGMPTHYHRPEDGEPIAIETHIHLLSDHITAARTAGLTLLEMHEAVIDDAYLAAKPKWAAHRGVPVSFVLVWGATSDGQA